MTTKKHFKQSKKSAVAFLSLAVAVMLSIIAGIITANASNNNFSATPENATDIVKPVPTPTPRANKRGTTSAKTTQTPNKPGVLMADRKANEGTTPAAVPTSGSKSIPKNAQRGQGQQPTTQTTPNGERGGSPNEVNCTLHCQELYELALKKCYRGPAIKIPTCEASAEKAHKKCTDYCFDY